MDSILVSISASRGRSILNTILELKRCLYQHCERAPDLKMQVYLVSFHALKPFLCLHAFALFLAIFFRIQFNIYN